MNKTLGARIAELRKEKGLTQEELAKQLGISSQAVSKWEKDISCPDIMILPSLAKILGVSIETLLTGEAETTYVPEEKRKSFEETILYIHVKEGTENIQLTFPKCPAFLPGSFLFPRSSFGKSGNPYGRCGKFMDIFVFLIWMTELEKN